MKTKISIILVFALAVVFASCKKDYSCTATSESGAESVFKCENCSKSDVEDYEASILENGYASANCEK